MARPPGNGAGKRGRDEGPHGANVKAWTRGQEGEEGSLRARGGQRTEAAGERLRAGGRTALMGARLCQFARTIQFYAFGV